MPLVVKNLSVKESPKDLDENTINWTELPKFIPHPDFDNNGPMPADISLFVKEGCTPSFFRRLVCDEKELVIIFLPVNIPDL